MFTWFQAGVIALAIVEREYLGIPSFPSREAAVEFFAGLEMMMEHLEDSTQNTLSKQSIWKACIRVEVNMSE